MVKFFQPGKFLDCVRCFNESGTQPSAPASSEIRQMTRTLNDCPANNAPHPSEQQSFADGSLRVRDHARKGVCEETQYVSEGEFCYEFT